MTVAQANRINQTSFSGENWPSPQHGNQLVFAGVTRVDRTAFPYPIPDALAAGTDPGPDCGGECWIAPPVDTPHPVAAAVDLETTADTGHLGEAVEEMTERLGAVESLLADVTIHVFGPAAATGANDIEGVMQRLTSMEERMEQLAQQRPPDRDPASTDQPVDLGQQRASTSSNGLTVRLDTPVRP